MKTTKFLAMLLAAFALAFSFASCGDDDDTPNPGNGGQNAGQTILKLGNVNINAKYAYWAIMNPHNDFYDGINNRIFKGYTIGIFFCEKQVESFYDLGEHAIAQLYLEPKFYVGTTDAYDVEIELPTEVPTGTFPYGIIEGEDPTGDFGEYYIYGHSGEFNFDSTETDKSKLTITKVGDEYKITSEPISFIHYTDYENKSQGKASFSFQGKITDLRHGE